MPEIEQNKEFGENQDNLKETQLEEIARAKGYLSVAELAEELIRRIHFAIQKMELYGSSHPIAQESLEQAYNFFRELLEKRLSITLSTSKEANILIDNIPMTKDYFTQKLARDFDKHNIQSLTFYRKLTFEDLFILLKFLEKGISHNPQKLHITEYLRTHKIISIEANLIKYKRVLGEGEEVKESFRDSSFEKILADHPEILASLIGADKDEAKKTAEMLKDIAPTIVESVGIDDIIDEIVKKIKEESFGKNATDIDRAIQRIIEDFQRNLGEKEKRELKQKLEELKKEITFEDGDKTAEYLDDMKTLKKAGLLKEVEAFIDMLSEGADISEMKQRLRDFLNSALVDLDKNELDAVYSIFRDGFVNRSIPAVLGSIDVLIEAIFSKTNQSIQRSFTNERIQEKSLERVFSENSEFLTTVLVWLTVHNLIKGNVLSALRIARVFEEKRKSESTSRALKNDAKTYFDSLSIGEPLDSVASVLDKISFNVSPEIIELFRLVGSKETAKRILSAFGFRDRDYVFRAVDVLKTLDRNVMGVFVDEVRSIKNQQRDGKGNLITDILRRRESGAMIALAMLEPDIALPIIMENTEDPDPAIRFAAFEAISLIGTPEASKLLLRYLYAQEGQFEGDIIRLIPRMDPSVVVPILEKLFHSRRDKWLEILHLIQQFPCDEAKRFLLDTLDTWNYYTNTLSLDEARDFLNTLLDSLANYENDQEVKKAVKLFITEWRGNDVLGGVKSFLGLKKDKIIERAGSIISKKVSV